MKNKILILKADITPTIRMKTNNGEVRMLYLRLYLLLT